ncbi:A-kinase anchor protein 8-like isoform X2 [Pungitius pungitius]|uniref:A-kinase anchor protein 8-like isoform X2 n=1 Tax=Pungitius pungitius TaxID=134920 RepID=UPI002E1324A0
MDGRSYGSGYSSWGGSGSGSRSSGGFDLYGGGYKGSVSGLGGYGGGGGHMKRGLSGASLLSSTGTNADAVIAKINQRLDMLTQLEGGLKGTRGDRYDHYESFDSRASALPSSRDLYRSGGGSYGYGGDGREDNMLLGQRGGSGFGGGIGMGGGVGGGGGGGGFDSPSSSYGVAKMRQNMRETFSSGQGGGSGGGGWPAAGRRSPRRGGSAGGRGAGGGGGGGGGFVSHRSEPTPLGGGGRGGGGHRGRPPGGGRGKLPSLLSNRMYPESGGFHQGSTRGPHDFPGRHFGGGPRAGRQRGRKRPLNKVKPPQDVQKKRKQSLTEADEPESKMNRTEEADAPQEPAENNGDDSEPKTETDPAADKDSPKQEEKATTTTSVLDKHNPTQIQDKMPKMRKRRGFLERVMFACSVCKFRSFYKEEMETHLDSRFHKDHFKFLCGQLSKPTTDFLQEYLQNKFKKTDYRVGQLENHSAAICQVYREQDLTRELGMEHFMRKVEAAHCAACDLFIPMQPHLIQKHIKSPDHNYNRKGMMEQSKRASLSVARSILNHKLIGKKLESYLKGENPFTGNHDDQDAEDSMVMDVSELELSSEAADGQAEQVEKVEKAVVEEESAQAEEAATTERTTTTTAGEEEKMEEGEEEQRNEEEEEGFEVGEEDEGYAVHDEIGEEGIQEEEEEEGVEVAEGEEELQQEENND